MRIKRCGDWGWRFPAAEHSPYIVASLGDLICFFCRPDFNALPFGALIGTVYLVRSERSRGESFYPENEAIFGNCDRNRGLLFLEHPQAIVPPIECRGGMGFWTYRPGECVDAPRVRPPLHSTFAQDELPGVASVGDGHWLR